MLNDTAAPAALDHSAMFMNHVECSCLLFIATLPPTSLQTSTAAPVLLLLTIALDALLLLFIFIQQLL